MRRLILGVITLALLAAPAWGIGGGAIETNAPRQVSVDQLNERGFDELNACLSTRRRVDALYVMDVSGSLQSNDPDGRRFDALESSINQLGTLASAGAGGRDVNVAVSTFGNGFSEPEAVHDWSALPSEGSVAGYASRVRSETERAWKAAGTNQGTNYEAAMEGAARVMRARGSTEEACQMVLWFTDGLFSLGDPYDQRATDAASRRMCKQGGTLDELRKSDVSVIALALTGADIEEQLSRPEYRSRQGELAAMAVGRSGDKLCGTTPTPRSWRPGIYLSADEPAVLGALFSGVAAQASGCVPSTVQTTLPARLEVDPGVGRFQVDVSLGAQDESLTIQAPGERPTEIRGGTSSYAGSRVQLAKSGNLASLRVTLPPAGVRGTWVVSGPGVQATSVSLYRCSDLHIEIAEPEAPLPGGEQSTVEAVVRDATGAPADLNVYRDLEDGSSIQVASVGAPNARGTVSDAASGGLSVTLVPPEDRLSVDVELSFIPVLKDSARTQLSPVNGSAVLPVSPPGSFPTISPTTELDLGQSRGLEGADGAWTVTGSSQGPSRVCFADPEGVDAPTEAGSISIDVSVECQQLAKGESITVDVSALPETSTDGDALAEVPVTLENADGDRIRENLVVRWEMQRVVDQGQRLQILLVALAVALAVPLLVLALVNYALARFRSGDVRFGSFEVDITADGDLVPLEPITVRGLSSRWVQGSERRRLANLGAGVDLVARASRNPLGSPRFVAMTSPGSRVIAGDATLQRKGLECEVTAGLGAVWILVISDHDLTVADPEQPVRARLLLITRQEGQDQLDRLAMRARVALSEGRWERLRRELGDLASSEDAPREPLGGGGPRTGAAAADERGEQSIDDADPFGFGEPTPTEPTTAEATPRRRGRGRSAAPAEPESSGDDTYEDPFA